MSSTGAVMVRSANVKASRLPSAKNTLFMLTDVQERFRGVLHAFDAVSDGCALLASAATPLGAPVLATEQVPAKLGKTVEEVHDKLPAHAKIFQKSSFSVMNEEMKKQMETDLPNVDRVVLAGLETHVCVQQTAFDLLQLGYTVHLAADATSSQRVADRSLSVMNMCQSGVVVTSCESVLMELVGSADADSFKPVSKLLKEYSNRTTLGL